MNIQIILIAIMLCSPLLSAFASSVRVLQINDSKMHPILLRIGRSTVIRFEDRPKKAVIGNKNFFDIEFIENDITIRPLGFTRTNLFVYTPKHTFGFLIKVTREGKYDSLLKAIWSRPKFKPPRVMIRGARIKRIVSLTRFKHFVDVSIKKSKHEVKITSKRNKIKVVQKSKEVFRVFFSSAPNKLVILTLKQKRHSK